ncbi:hypothetical protein L6164_006506 [Bauhinia variegata]|uniref:Uncharacterized protein n=1 Tax=Bauhinia variegata TaxID=167791 RepID=A0ACB9PWG9_BAUVA|nr:hypothetical protein L6164_006506 [Bauhinia variegata]
MSFSETHTIMAGKFKSFNLAMPYACGLQYWWSRVAPSGRAKRQYVSEADTVSAESGGCLECFSEIVLSSPPKNGWIRMSPLRDNGFRIVGAYEVFDVMRVTTLKAMLAPALSPTRNRLDRLH